MKVGKVTWVQTILNVIIMEAFFNESDISRQVSTMMK